MGFADPIHINHPRLHQSDWVRLKAARDKRRAVAEGGEPPSKHEERKRFRSRSCRRFSCWTPGLCRDELVMQQDYVQAGIAKAEAVKEDQEVNLRLLFNRGEVRGS